MTKISEYKAIYFNPDDTDFEKMHKVHMNNIKRITANIDNKCLSDMLFDRDERLITYIIELGDRIDKAIEYIKRNCLEFNIKYACQGLNNDKVDVLLDILRGKDNGTNRLI